MGEKQKERPGSSFHPGSALISCFTACVVCQLCKQVCMCLS